MIFLASISCSSFLQVQLFLLCFCYCFPDYFWLFCFYVRMLSITNEFFLMKAHTFSCKSYYTCQIKYKELWMYRFKRIKRRKYISLLWKFGNSEKSSQLAYKCIGASFPSMGGSAAWLLSCHSSWLMSHPSFYSLLMCTSLCLYHLLDLLVFFGHLLLEIILKSAIAIVLYKIVEGFLRNRLHLVKDLLV